MATFAVATLGCKVNSYESQGYAQGLEALGYNEVEFPEKADIYIINTCTVTNIAARKSRQKIHLAKKINPDAFICIAGCLSQTDHNIEEIGCDVVIGSSHKDELPKLLDEAYRNHKHIYKVDDVSNFTRFDNININNFEHKTRAFLKIQDGCNQFCSYCIIPYARGRERSLDLDKCIAQAVRLVENGNKEIVLTGIHTGRYMDSKGNDLKALIEKLIKIDGLERIRLSSIEMNEVSDDILELMKNNEKIAKHLHIPIQSACNRILHEMNRPYTVEEFIDRVSEIRKQIPNISISTDIIMGFPGETVEDFNDTFENLKQINFSFMHIFPYSKRDGTKASLISPQLTMKEKKERCADVSILSETNYNKYKSTFIGQNVKVLFEYMDDGFAVGHSSEYILIKARSERNLTNEMKNVRIEKIGRTMEGSVVK